MARVKLTEEEIRTHGKALAKDVLGEEQYRKNKIARDEIMLHFKTGALWAQAILSIKQKAKENEKRRQTN